MYSEKIKAIKPNKPLKTQGRERTVRMLQEFCTRDDVIGAPCTALLKLFDDFCAEKGYPLLEHKHVGRVLRDFYKVGRRAEKVNGDVVWVYCEKWDCNASEKNHKKGV